MCLCLLGIFINCKFYFFYEKCFLFIFLLYFYLMVKLLSIFCAKLYSSQDDKVFRFALGNIKERKSIGKRNILLFVNESLRLVWLEYFLMIHFIMKNCNKESIYDSYYETMQLQFTETI